MKKVILAMLLLALFVAPAFAVQLPTNMIRSNTSLSGNTKFYSEGGTTWFYINNGTPQNDPASKASSFYYILRYNGSSFNVTPRNITGGIFGNAFVTAQPVHDVEITVSGDKLFVIIPNSDLNVNKPTVRYDVFNTTTSQILSGAASGLGYTASGTTTCNSYTTGVGNGQRSTALHKLSDGTVLGLTTTLNNIDSDRKILVGRWNLSSGTTNECKVSAAVLGSDNINFNVVASATNGTDVIAILRAGYNTSYRTYRISNNGETFQELNNFSKSSSAFIVYYINGGSMFCEANNCYLITPREGLGQNITAFYRSLNGGQTWNNTFNITTSSSDYTKTLASEELSIETITAYPIQSIFRNSGNLTIAMKKNKQFVYVSSVDNGTSWSPETTFMSSVLTFNADNAGNIVVAREGGNTYYGQFGNLGSFGFDITSPVITIISPSGEIILPTISSPVQFKLNFTASDTETGMNLSTCKYSLDGAANVSLPLCSNATISTTTGSHSIQVFATDNSGNIGNAQSSFSIKFPPTVQGATGTALSLLPIVFVVMILIGAAGIMLGVKEMSPSLIVTSGIILILGVIFLGIISGNVTSVTS